MKHEALVVRSAPFALFIVLLAGEPVLASALPTSIDARWLYGVRSLVVALLLAGLWKRYEELRQQPSPGAAGWALGAGIGVLVFVLWINLDFPPLVVGSVEGGFDPRDAGDINWGLALARLAAAAFLVPVMEELFWRSFIMRWLERSAFLSVDPGSVGWKAVIISAIVFAAEHNLWFAGLIAGVAYGWVYVRTRNLWVPILAHAITNGLLGAYVLSTGSWSFW